MGNDQSKVLEERIKGAIRFNESELTIGENDYSPDNTLAELRPKLNKIGYDIYWETTVRKETQPPDPLELARQIKCLTEDKPCHGTRYNQVRSFYTTKVKLRKITDEEIAGQVRTSEL